MSRYRAPGVEIHSLESMPDDLGTNDAWWGLATLHVKAADADCPFLLANELICCRLAAALGLPVLPGEIAQLADGRRGWVTPQIRTNGVSAPPTTSLGPVLVRYAHILAGALVFDVWVHNEDRHIENFLFHPNLGIWLIDHEHSLLGRDGRHRGALYDGPLRWYEYAVSDVPADALQYWINRVRSLPEGVISLAINEAHQRGLLGTKPNVKEFLDLLICRQQKIVSLVNSLPKARPGSSGARIIPIRRDTVGTQLELD